MLMPDSIIDYIVVHELCHRKEMNHSKKFWGEVQNILPDLVYKSDDSDFLSVNYIEIIPFLVKKLQLQDEEIKSLKKENAELKNKISFICEKLNIQY